MVKSIVGSYVLKVSVFKQEFRPGGFGLAARRVPPVAKYGVRLRIQRIVAFKIITNRIISASFQPFLFKSCCIEEISDQR
jgi:hypothetical protein